MYTATARRISAGFFFVALMVPHCSVVGTFVTKGFVSFQKKVPPAALSAKSGGKATAKVQF